MTDLPFVSALVQADLPVWEQCLQTEFLQKMENGTLSEDCFKSYLVEDSLYLREYAKIFAWGMTKATTMAAMRTYYSLLSFVQENEDLTRLRYLEQYGLREADIQSRMRHNNQPELARPFQNAQIFRIIQIGLLIGRMNFDASHVPGGNAVKLLLPIHIIRMDAGERKHICDKRMFIVSSGSVVDMVYLLRLCGDRKNDRTVNACGPFRQQQSACRAAGIRGNIGLVR